MRCITIPPGQLQLGFPAPSFCERSVSTHHFKWYKPIIGLPPSWIPCRQCATCCGDFEGVPSDIRGDPDKSADSLDSYNACSNGQPEQPWLESCRRSAGAQGLVRSAKRLEWNDPRQREVETLISSGRGGHQLFKVSRVSRLHICYRSNSFGRLEQLSTRRWGCYCGHCRSLINVSTYQWFRGTSFPDS